MSIAPLQCFCIGSCSLEWIIEKIRDMLLHNIHRVGDSVNEDFLSLDENIIKIIKQISESWACLVCTSPSSFEAAMSAILTDVCFSSVKESVLFCALSMYRAAVVSLFLELLEWMLCPSL